jgi:NAD(P)-dependent dehydrogenase (short-subunit alcohol dehydrogenase family)
MDVVASDICRNVPAVGYAMGAITELEETAEAVRALGRKSIAVRADVTKAGDVQRMVEEAIAEFDRVDVLVNNAGIALIGIPVDEVSEEQWDLLLSVNLKGAWLCCKYVVPLMRKQRSDRIINIASHCGLIGIATLAPYNCSKHGLVGLTRTLAVELASFGITANAICPAAVATPMLEESFRLAGMKREDADKQWGAGGLLTEVIPPESISAVVAWLASDEARYINGRSLLVGNTTGLIP